jgi:hypothetical protein
MSDRAGTRRLPVARTSVDAGHVLEGDLRVGRGPGRIRKAHPARDAPRCDQLPIAKSETTLRRFNAISSGGQLGNIRRNPAARTTPPSAIATTDRDPASIAPTCLQAC